MNKTRQELYEKLLKKVNEYCLGYAAEDVIAAIDALVENYETPKVDSIIKNEYYLGTEKVSQQVYETIQMYKQMLSAYESRSSTNMDLDDALKVIYDSQDIMGGHDDFWKAYRTIETALKALEIIKSFFMIEDFQDFVSLNGRLYKKPHKEKYELLKEVLK